MTTEQRELIWIPLREENGGQDAPAIASSPFPPREPGDIAPLVSSVRALGVLSPILLRRNGDALEIVSGYRRYLAAIAAGLDRVPALLAELDDSQAIRCYLSENLLAKPLEGRSEAGAIEVLTNLRNAWPGDPGLKDFEEKLSVLKTRAGRSRIETTDEARPSSSSVASEPRGVEGNEPARPEDRVLALSRAFFEEVRATRAINVPRTEILLDSILEVPGAPGLPAAALERLKQGDVIAPHSILVAQLCDRVARELGWDEESVRTFALGGFLHDVGMVFVSDLTRVPRVLSADEGTRIETHTRIGCALISGTREWSPSVALAARDHHERWNGTGYPSRKTGTETGLQARALGLIDAYAALITPRPHRSALSHTFAMERLSQAMDRGLFDPELRPILEEALAKLPLEPGSIERATGDVALTRNSVELKGELVTMLAKGST